MPAHRALISLAVVTLAVAGCTPRGKTYGPVGDAAQAERVAKAELSGSLLARGPFTVIKQGGTWIVEASQASESARLEIDARTGRVRSYTDEIVEVDLILPPSK